MTDQDDVVALHRSVLAAWNVRDAARFASLFADDGSIVGFDGSPVDGREEIHRHLAAIFADHDPARYVAIVRDARAVGDGAFLVRSAVGMVPPGAQEVKREVNAMQALVATRSEGVWVAALLQSTPARFDGRPAAADELTAELQAELDVRGVVS